MEPKTSKTETTQGAKTVPNKERKPSTIFTIKSFAGIINKMHKLRMITDGEHQVLKELHGNITARWIGLYLENGKPKI